MKVMHLMQNHLKENVISDKYFALKLLFAIVIISLFLSNKIDSPFVYIKCISSVSALLNLHTF